MKVITFYSFKGGVGRSHLLLNTAWLLARDGARVVVADWDLHAPGLSLLGDLLHPEDPSPRPGVLDYLLSVVDPDEGDEDEILDPAAMVGPTRLASRLPQARHDPGGIWFVPCGRIDPSLAGLDGDPVYDAQLSRLRPRLDLAASDPDARMGLLDHFADRVAAHFTEQDQPAPDYLLLDARTGLTELGELLSTPMADQVVLVFGLNQQNVEGMIRTVQAMLRDTAWSVDERMARLVLVASPVPVGEEELKAQRFATARERLREIMFQAEDARGGLHGRTLHKPRLHSIPYHPRVALSEDLVTELWPEAEISRAIGVVAERVRIPRKGELEVDRATTRARLEQVEPMDEDRPAPQAVEDRRKPQGRHPMSRQLPWDFFAPGTPPEQVFRAPDEVGVELRAAVLQGLSDTISLTQAEVEAILASASKLNPGQVEELADILAEEREKFLGINTAWPTMADLFAKGWVSWSEAVAAHLDLDRDQVGQRLVQAWPAVLTDQLGQRATTAAAEALLARTPPRWSPAEALLDRVLQQAPQALRALALRARIDLCRQEGAEDPAEWSGPISRAVRSAGDLWTMRGVLTQAGAPVERRAVLTELALSAARAALPRLESDASAWTAVGTLALERWRVEAEDQDPELARLIDTCFRRALELEPGNHHAAHNWGNALLAQARALRHTDLDRALLLWQQASRRYQQALDIKPDKHETANNWGNALDDQARALVSTDRDRALQLWEQAGRRYQQALDIKPDKHEAAYNWGNALLVQARTLASTDLARALQLWHQVGLRYQQALDIKPGMHEAASNWGSALDDQARALANTDLDRALQLWEQAGRRYQQALDIKPGDLATIHHRARTLSNLHHALKGAGRADDAQRAAQALLDLARHTAELSGQPEYNLACALALTGRSDEALAELERVKNSPEGLPAHVATDPDLESLHDLAGWKALLES